jgi:putative ABC transport system substrate-binding protein
MAQLRVAGKPPSAEVVGVVAEKINALKSAKSTGEISFTDVHRAKIVSLAARYHLPAVCPWRFFTEIGGLLSYGSVHSDMLRIAAIYVDRILKGEQPV